MVSQPVSYVASSGERVEELETTLRVVMLSMGRIHPSIAVTGAICVSAAANLDGTIANIVARDDRGGPRHRIGHPAGVMDVAAEPLLVNDEWVVPSVTVYRTARRLFEGAVCIDIPA